MDIVVPIKMVPDLVEELEIDAEGRDLDRSFLKLRLSEWDEQAVEEALLLKDKHGARVTVIALDLGDVDETLFTCLAKGADRAIKLTGGETAQGSSRATADVLAKALKGIPHDLILTGVQAVDDRDGQVAVFADQSDFCRRRICTFNLDLKQEFICFFDIKIYRFKHLVHDCKYLRQLMYLMVTLTSS